MMLVAPLLQQGVVLTLPTALHTADKPDTADQTVVYIDGRSRMYINQIEVAPQDVASRLGNVLADKVDRTVYLKGDTNAPYSAIMDMMDALRKAGIETVGLITERPGGTMGGE
jgi:biopolymer transport protein ExbD